MTIANFCRFVGRGLDPSLQPNRYFDVSGNSAPFGAILCAARSQRCGWVKTHPYITTGKGLFYKLKNCGDVCLLVQIKYVPANLILKKGLLTKSATLYFIVFQRSDGQALATLSAAAGNDLAAVLGGHTLQETVNTAALTLLRLESTLHFSFLLLKSPVWAVLQAG